LCNLGLSHTARSPTAVGYPAGRHPQRAVELEPALHLKIGVGDEQDFRIAVAAEPPAVMGERGRAAVRDGAPLNLPMGSVT
jgi:hypothetical protein